jgi:biopolymer transport protein ExbB
LPPPIPKNLLLDVEEALGMGELKQLKKFAAIPGGLLPAFSTRVLANLMKASMLLKNQLLPMAVCRQDLLEKNMTWISLFISLAPMLGFMGTVIGMIAAFDSIEAAGDISPSLVAGGIKVALITTVSGLVVAIILQVFIIILHQKSIHW